MNKLFFEEKKNTKKNDGFCVRLFVLFEHTHTKPNKKVCVGLSGFICFECWFEKYKKNIRKKLKKKKYSWIFNLPCTVGYGVSEYS